MISRFRLMSASRHAQLSPYPEFCRSWLLSTPACLPSRDFCRSAQLKGSLQASRSAQKMYGGNDEANPRTMPTNIYLEGPYPDITDINIMNGTTGYPILAGGCVSEQPEPSLGSQGSTEEQFLGCPGFAVGRAWSMAAQGEQSQPSVTPAQLQWHEQARF